MLEEGSLYFPKTPLVHESYSLYPLSAGTWIRIGQAAPQQDPSRMFRRYLKSHGLFDWLILKELLNRNSAPNPHPQDVIPSAEDQP